jgi:hypothetical protein
MVTKFNRIFQSPVFAVKHHRMQPKTQQLIASMSNKKAVNRVGDGVAEYNDCIVNCQGNQINTDEWRAPVGCTYLLPRNGSCSRTRICVLGTNTVAAFLFVVGELCPFFFSFLGFSFFTFFDRFVESDHVNSSTVVSMQHLCSTKNAFHSVFY